MIEFRVLDEEDMRPIWYWRNRHREAWRSEDPTTWDEQLRWYHKVVCAKPRMGAYWAVMVGTALVGQVELSNARWCSHIAEIGLIIGDEYRHKGYAREAVRAAVIQGFDYLGLETIEGEVFECNDAWRFWKKMVKETGGEWQKRILKRKLWAGVRWPSYGFGWEADKWQR